MKNLFHIRKTILVNLITMFVILNAPIYLFTVYMNHQVEQSILQRSMDAIHLNARYFLKSFETEIERIDSLKNSYLVHEDFLKLANEGPFMEPYTKSELILSVKDKLDLLKTSSPFVQEIKVYFPSLKRGVFASSYEDRMSEDEISRITESYLTNAMLYGYGSSLAMGGLNPVPMKIDNIAFAMEIVLSQPTIELMLSEIGSLNSYENGSAMLFSPELEWVISDSPELMDNHSLKQRMYAMQSGSKQPAYDQMNLNGTEYMVVDEVSEKLGVHLMVTVPKSEMTGMLSRYKYTYFVILMASLLLVLVFSYAIYRLIHRPFQSLLAGLRRVEKGDYDVVLSTRKGDEFSTVYRQFNSMAGRIKILIQEVFEHKIRLQSSELKQLQSQINPHFLYNSYYVVYRLAQNHDLEKVVEYTRFLGDYFKYITRNASDIVNLADEFHHAQAYIQIQMIRFSKRIITESDGLPAGVESLQVPKLILQPLIENAYTHGLGSKLSDGFLKISFVREEQRLKIVIEDNGNELTDTALAELHTQLMRSNDDLIYETTGLINVHKRLQLKFGKDYGLHLERSKLGGLSITITIPEHQE
ncbi:hypothetical protein BK133_03785 [Paenibacillus sp. FSL H8-0548]|uniref:sensor histidine kinase n=1 Tax=Paenibacillus sp. FSL H8-0548 TaxID=1920422 RepID=UPI00096F661A|nr:histidine kinase [Paenibacillus sp. FSL H8-0548]OMF37673.1 hypothetical protein BK133_03785 [Paenibacillus sp. FSL H8-0548]